MHKQHQRDMRRFLESTADLQRSKVGSAAFYTLDRIDQKTGTLLTHVSIMLGMTALVYTQLTTGQAVRWAFEIELLVYLTITLGCLYTIVMTKPRGLQIDPAVAMEEGLNRVFRRLAVYRTCLFATLINTLLFMATFIVESHPRL
jgi:hypothetical protein